MSYVRIVSDGPSGLNCRVMDQNGAEIPGVISVSVDRFTANDTIVARIELFAELEIVAEDTPGASEGGGE